VSVCVLLISLEISGQTNLAKALPYLTLPYLRGGLAPSAEATWQRPHRFQIPCPSSGRIWTHIQYSVPWYPTVSILNRTSMCWAVLFLLSAAVWQTDKQYTTGSQVTLAHIWRIQCNLKISHTFSLHISFQYGCCYAPDFGGFLSFCLCPRIGSVGSRGHSFTKPPNSEALLPPNSGA